ncbi:MAG: threonine--tRNA ligase [Verrucomicrobiota bacterium]|jgi:threonyl-tRNA synthetase
MEREIAKDGWSATFAPHFMSDERKTLEQRNQMTDLERLRHSAAHVLATAILRIWPEAQFAAGPPVEQGFYYDVELSHRITPEDFARIEEEMKKEIKANNVFERTVVSRAEALALAESGRLGGLSERPGNASKFKIGNLADIPEGEEISLFKNGDFLDLCAGPHVMRTGNIGAFKLTHVASAYYKGDEKNPQLQRIYGTAFKNKTQMEEYFTMVEEAKKRDHRKLGKELELFTFDEDVGPGLPLWLPNGTVLIEELEKLAKETEFAAGYDRVRTPHLARENMYLTSGHLPYYAESMFPAMELDEFKAKRAELTERRAQLHGMIIAGAKSLMVGTTIVRIHGVTSPIVGGAPKLEQVFELTDKGRAPEQLEAMVLDYKRTDEELMRLDEPDRYYLKAMNCPHHHKIFGAVPRSYRDLPLRLAEYGTCYRYEQSGELMGLMRVRSMQMNDAHIYCTEEQFEEEFRAVNEMYLKYFRIFGFEKYQMRFSTHDPAKLGQKFVDEPELWKKTEDMVRNVLIKSGINYVEVPNEAAFYGPKIDVQVWSAIGKEFTIATNQVDFAVPARFKLQYRTRDNAFETPLCIHRAPLGTHERFIGFLIEHYAGNFPLWLAPEQVSVITIGTDEPLVAYGKAIVAELRANGVRAQGDFGTDKMQGKIQQAEQRKVHTMLVLGNRDLEAGNVSVRLHGKGNVGAKKRDEAIADILSAIKERRA